MKGEIKQICILVKDVYETMRNFWEILEIGPWEVRHFNPRNCSYFEVDGKELTEGFDFIAAVAWAGEIEFELVQPIEGPNVYWDVLDKKGPCLHHFKVVIQDTDELQEYLQELGEKYIPVTQTGRLEGDIHAYIGTEDKFGFIMEMGNGGDISPAPEVYPPEAVGAVKKQRTVNIRQIGILVDDVTEYLRNFTAVLDIQPWNIYRFDPRHVSYFEVGGKELTEGFDFITCCCKFGNMELELMQPVEGPNVYWDDLNTVGVGLHHIKDVMPDDVLIKTVEKYKKQGIHVLQCGHLDEDWHYYMDTKDKLSFILELGNGGNINSPVDVYPK